MHVLLDVLVVECVTLYFRCFPVALDDQDLVDRQEGISKGKDSNKEHD